MRNAAPIATLLEIATGHQPFSDQFQCTVNQTSILVGQTYCIFSMEGQ